MKCLKPKIAVLDTRRGTKVGTERIRGYELIKIRDRILLRDGYRCRVCGRVGVEMEVDHIMPLYQGGAESDENRQVLCGDCHRAKSEREERESGGGASNV